MAPKLAPLDDLEFRAKLSPNAYERLIRRNAEIVSGNIEFPARMRQQAEKALTSPLGLYSRQQRRFLDERGADINTMVEELYPQMSDVLPIAYQEADFRRFMTALYDKGYNVSRSDR